MTGIRPDRKFLASRGVLTCVLALPFATQASASVVADSVADYSGTQGKDNWSYGYYDRHHDADGSYDASSDFQQMPHFGEFPPVPGWSVWYVHTAEYWTMLTPHAGHPNGPISGRLPVEHWPVRRWVAEVAGQITISGTVAKGDVGGGDGTTAYIFVDGTSIWSKAIAATDATGVDFTVNATVAFGSTVDFVIAPNATDSYDTTRFTATITATAEGQLRGLKAFIASRLTSGQISPELEQSLLTKVDAALDALARDNPNAAKVAMNDLKALVNQVEAQTDKKIEAATAAEIIERASRIITDLGG